MNPTTTPPPINSGEAQLLLNMIGSGKFTYSLGDFQHMQQLLARSLALVATGQATFAITPPPET